MHEFRVVQTARLKESANCVNGGKCRMNEFKEVQSACVQGSAKCVNG